MPGGGKIPCTNGQDHRVPRLELIGDLLFHQGQLLNLQSQLPSAFAHQCPFGAVALGIIAVFLRKGCHLRRIEAFLPGEIEAHHGKAGGAAAGDADHIIAIAPIAPLLIPLQEKRYSLAGIVGRQVNGLFHIVRVFQHKLLRFRISLQQLNQARRIVSVGIAVAVSIVLHLLLCGRMLTPAVAPISEPALDLPGVQTHRRCQHHQQTQQGRRQNPFFLHMYRQLS